MNLTFEVRDGAADVPRIRHALSSALMREENRTDTATVELVLTELLTNAVVHGAMPIKVSVHARLDERPAPRRDTVRIEVCDSAPSDVPHRVRAGAASETGRGLLLVSALASRWGVEPERSGKSVWAEIDAHVDAHPEQDENQHASGRASSNGTSASHGDPASEGIPAASPGEIDAELRFATR